MGNQVSYLREGGWSIKPSVHGRAGGKYGLSIDSKYAHSWTTKVVKSRKTYTDAHFRFAQPSFKSSVC